MAARVQYRQGGRIFDQIGRATLEETRKEIVATASREHGRVLRTDPRPASWRQYVDGVEGARFEAVRSNGVIVIDYSRLGIVVQYAMDTLFDLSPVLSGDYRNGHTLYVDGVSARNLENYDGATEIVITNTLEYARKIERGAMTMTKPGSDHVYQQAEMIVSRQFGGIADVRFTYRGVIGGGVQDYAAIGLGGRRGGKTASAGKRAAYQAHQDNRFPALVIRPGQTRNLDAFYSRMSRRA